MERKLYLYSALFFTVLIAIGSVVAIPTIRTGVSYFDKILHFLAYFVLTFSWLLTFKFKSKQLKISLLVLMFVFIYGIIIEVIQGVLITYRQLDYLDVLANAIGILIAYIVFVIFFKRNKGQSKNKFV